MVKKKANLVVSDEAALPPRGSAPSPEAGRHRPPPDLLAVRFRRQDGMYSPRGGVYQLPEPEARKFIRQGSAELAEDEYMD